jgi:hypothetical protein
VWLHFGGKREQSEKLPIDTAIREFHEETAGIFLENSEVTKMLQVGNYDNHFNVLEPKIRSWME